MLHIATLSDTAAIAALISPYIPDFAMDIRGAEKLGENIIAKLVSADDVVYYLAKNQATQMIIGVIAYKKPAHLLHFFVAKAYQHQGIGKKMWLTIENEMWLGSDVISVNSSLAAQAVYEHFGFVAISPVQEQSGLRYIMMEKHKPLA